MLCAKHFDTVIKMKVSTFATHGTTFRVIVGACRGQVLGAGIGLVLGIIMGEAGMAYGLLLGAALGTVIGAVMGAAKPKKGIQSDA
jgi:hypothetical protein